MNDEITRRTCAEVFAIARKTLNDLSGTSLEAQMSEVFIERLRALDDESRQLLADALKTSSQPALIHSAYELTIEQREIIQSALNDVLGSEVQVRFNTAPEVISGIELTINGQKVAWSITDYLRSLEDSLDDLLEKPATSETKAKSGPELEPAPPSGETL